MTSEVEQIVACYEKEGMTAEEISTDRDLQLPSVKAALMQGSVLYRKACKKEQPEEDTLNFSDDDLRDVNRVIKEIAVGAEDDHLRLKAAIYIRDDKKGRKEVVKGIQGTQFNILTFNEGMKELRGKAEEMKNRVLGGNGNGVVNV